MSCLDSFSHLSSRPARTTPYAPWLSEVLCEHLSKLRAAERVWCKSQNPTDLYRSLLSDLLLMSQLLKGHTIMTKLTIRLTLACSLKHFLPFCPPPPSAQTADNFATFFINTITNLTAQLSTPQTVKHILPANIHLFIFFSHKISSLNLGCSRVRFCQGLIWFLWSCPNDRLGDRVFTRDQSLALI